MSNTTSDSSSPDTTAPVLKSLIIPTSLDLSQGTKEFTISSTATDDKSGVKQVVVWFDKDISYSFSVNSNQFNNYNLLVMSGSSDSWSDGASQDTRWINAFNQSGIYNVSSVDVSDMVGNVVHYSASQLSSMGVNTKINFTGSNPDTTAPALKSLIIPTAIDLSNGTAEFTIYSSATDDKSGVKQVVVWFDKDISYSFSASSNQFSNYNLLVMSGSSDSWSDGASRDTRWVNSSNKLGVYNVSSVDVTDMVGNVAHYTASQLSSMGVNTKVDFSNGAIPTPVTNLKFNALETIDILNLPGRENGVSSFKATNNYFTFDGPNWDISGSGSNLSYSSATSGSSTLPISGKLDSITYSHQGRLVFKFTDMNSQVSGDSYNDGYNFAGLKLTGTLGAFADWFKANDSIIGSNSADVLAGFAGNDKIDGGGGIDTAVYAGLRSGFEITVKENGDAIINDKSGFNGTDSLTSIERLQFLDHFVAIDFSNDGHAGSTAKILGAVFGADAVHNLSYAGIGLKLLDEGMSYSDLIHLALQAKLGVSATNADVVNLLYGNVMGASPSQSDFNYFKELLDSNQLSQSDLAKLAAETSQNAQRIDLVGLSVHGLDCVI